MEIWMNNGKSFLTGTSEKIDIRKARKTELVKKTERKKELRKIEKDDKHKKERQKEKRQKERQEKQAKERVNVRK